MKPEELREILRKNGLRWTWWGQRTHDALGLDRLLDFEAFITCDYGTGIEGLWEGRVISPELFEGRRRNYSNEDINEFLKSSYREPILDRISSGSECVMYRSISELERLARVNREIRIYSAPVRLKSAFDNKVLFREKLRSLGIEPIPGKTAFLENTDYGAACGEWGEKFVVKYPVSSSGKKTHLVENGETFGLLKSLYPGEPVIIEKHLEGFSLNINAVIEENMLISDPSLQVVGSSALADGRFAFCGNDFSSAAYLDNNIISEIKTQTFTVMKWMRNWGFKGLMGMDFIVSAGRVYPVEINPRFQNSTSLLTLLELGKNIIPLEYSHLTAFNRELPRPEYEGSGTRFEGAQLIMHNLEDRDIAIEDSMRPGIYRTVKEGLQFLRHGYSVLDCRSDEEFAVCGGVPAANTVIEKGAPLLKLHFRKNVLDSGLSVLNKEIELTVKKIYNCLVRNEPWIETRNSIQKNC
ncbi:MAG: ATP-grasp domain-containing protein [Elusimicrobia bacterium]|nr:ATP-grasp domain-containing protein [Elusimicrobiota bacterium]